jgi:hypothetical protein
LTITRSIISSEGEFIEKIIIFVTYYKLNDPHQNIHQQRTVQKEFASERLRIFDWIQSDALLGQYFAPVLFEKLPAAAQRPSEVYLNEVRESQIYLVILGQEYDYEDANGVSPTELEYECAKKHNLYKIAFIKGESSLERNSKQKTFIFKVQNELTYRRFDNIEVLISQIYAALVEYLKNEGLIHTKSSMGLLQRLRWLISAQKR